MYYYDPETSAVIAGWLIEMMTALFCAVIGHKRTGSLMRQERGVKYYRCWRCGATGDSRPGEPIRWHRRIQMVGR